MTSSVLVDIDGDLHDSAGDVDEGADDDAGDTPLVRALYPLPRLHRAGAVVCLY